MLTKHNYKSANGKISSINGKLTVFIILKNS